MAQDFTRLFNIGDNTGISTIDPAGVALIGIQELSKQNEALQEQNNLQAIQISDLKSSLSSLETKLEQLATMQEVCCNAINANPGNLPSHLDQNVPNPFDGNTMIGYYIPASAKTAVITILTQSGQAVKTFTIAGRGNGQLEFDSQTLTSGYYLYNLVVDGIQIASKKMTIVKN